MAELEEIGVDVLAVHTGADAQAVGREPIQDLKVMTGCARKLKSQLPEESAARRLTNMPL